MVATPQLAEQNARLVDAVNKLRLRSRMLIWAVLALTAGVVTLLVR